jgi:O-antigen/teichoic acid export membrane protein
VLVVLGLRASPEGVLLLALASATLLAVGAAPFVWRTGVRPAGVDRRLLRRMLWLSTPMIGLMVSQYVFGSIDIVALRMFRTQSEVGIYAVSYQAYTVLAAAATTATVVLIPLFVSLQAAGRRQVIQRYFRQGVPQGLFFIAVACGLAAALVPLLVPVVFGHAFRSASTPMSVLIAGLAFLFGAYLAAPILTLHEQTRATAVFNAIAALINVVLDLLLIGAVHMGVIAPALATSAALAYMFAAFYVRARRLLALDTRPGLVLMAPLLAGLAPAVTLGGALGAILGVAGVALAAAAILAWRSPFTRSDVDVIAKLELPPAVKRAAIKLVLRVT